MAKRILPKPDAFATAPPADVSILEHYAGTFEAVYVLLHPFIDANGIGTERFEPGTYPDRQVIAKNCRGVPWAEIVERAGLPSIAAVDVGLRTGIHGLKAEFSNQEFAAKVESLIESSRILLPARGAFPTCSTTECSLQSSPSATNGYG